MKRHIFRGDSKVAGEKRKHFYLFCTTYNWKSLTFCTRNLRKNGVLHATRHLKNQSLLKMTSLELIKKFLDEVTDISLGSSEIIFLRSSELDDGQIGYRVDANGKSLITGQDGDWQENWIVIASDYVGDPLFVDITSPTFTILCAAHGEMTWDPMIIADSLDNLKEIISILATVSKHRTNPVDLDADPINEDERRSVLKAIQNSIPHLDIGYWEIFLEN